jgi:phospholipid/cholesterol/gamma-HCH transport system ATP-binding protein
MIEPTADPVIEVRDLVVRHGERTILDRISLRVDPGEIMVIIGGSGTGKTTLMRALLGLKRPHSGTINMLGTEITTANARELREIRKSIGVAFQGGALFSSMTVAENVQLPLREHTKLDENTIQIMTRIKLDMVNLLGFEHLMPSELSGGMTKRAALARAVITDPKLLFFDEPSSGLDPITSAELDELILKLRDVMRMTIFVVTHELESVFAIADRIIVLGEGEVIVSGTQEQIRASSDARVQNLLTRKPRDNPQDADLHLRRLTGKP